MNEKLMNAVFGEGENHILPFLWMLGEDISVTLRQMHRIYDCGIRAVCLESRTFEDFCGESWWTTLCAVLEEARKLGMKVWVLDDKHFPTGYAVGLIEKKYPERRRLQLAEKHLDVLGPRRVQTLISPYEADDVLLGAIAVRREERGDALTDESILLTPNANGKYLTFDVPEGCWRVFTLWQTHAGGGSTPYINMLDESSVDVLIEAVYDAHYTNVGEYFGKELVGFFSDEPSFGNTSVWHGMPNGGMYTNTVGQPGLALPWCGDLPEQLGLSDRTALLKALPLLWYEGNGSAEMRVRYMDTITRLYGKRFTGRLGAWCRAHNVEYIGHIIEDNGAHARLSCSCGHFFRSLEAQTRSGMDIVLHQVMPGFAEFDNAACCSGNKVSSMFFHYTIGKLAASLAHIRSHMQNRAMCEVFGAYGWAEDLPTMKWLIDYLLVRGINSFVPHAFSPLYPNPDCPPHFDADGQNPQFEDFAHLMRYTNRMADILRGNRVTKLAVLYHAEAEWAGKGYMPCDAVARELMTHGLDFDIVPADDLASPTVENGVWQVGNAAFRALILSEAACLPETVKAAIAVLREKGIAVLQVNTRTDGLSAECVPLTALSETLIARGLHDIRLAKPCPALRYSHVERADGSQVYMFFNESVTERAETDILLPEAGGFAEIDLLGNSVKRGFAKDGLVHISLSPFASVVLAFDGEDTPADAPLPCTEEPLTAKWRIEAASCEDLNTYTLLAEDLSAPETVEGRLPDFSGRLRYSCLCDLKNVRGLRLHEVGDTAQVFVNGTSIGRRICPPYDFDLASVTASGKDSLVIEVSTTLVRAQRDPFSEYMAFNLPGLAGEVTLIK